MSASCVTATRLPSAIPGDSLLSISPHVVALTVIVAAVASVAACCSWLNSIYYESHAPFYDSLSYTTGLHKTMLTARESGILASLASATTGDTVFLPYVPAALLGALIAPSRAVGVWIQALELMVLCGSVVTYLMRIERFSLRTALLACAPLMLMGRLWRPEGGLSDFRMDFGLMAGYWTTAAWYLISRASLARRDFVILGLACGATCLMRATAPVYILCGMAPLAIADFMRLPERKRRCIGWLMAAIIASLTAGWFYVLNYQYLHWYYVIWNNDANARLGPLKSWRHGLFAIRHAGAGAILLAALVRGAIMSRSRAGHIRADSWHRIIGVRPAILWLTVAPLALLIVQGAGLNPFVSMPSSLGLLLLILVPARPASDTISLSVRSAGWLSAAVAILAVITLTQSIASHRDPASRAMTVHKSILRAIIDDALATGATTVSVGASVVGPVHAYSLHNVALYDMPDTRADARGPVIAGVLYVPDGSLEVASKAVWEGIPGETPAAKLRALSQQAEQTIDYLVIPTPATCRLFEERLSHDLMNRHATGMREHLMEGGAWHRILADVEFVEGMRFDVVRNSLRSATGGKP